MITQARTWLLGDGDGHVGDLIAATGLAVVCAVGALAINVTVTRVIFALPLCMLLPGYALRCAIFARVQLEPGTRLMLIPGLSLVALILSSLLLNEFPGGLQKGTWAGWLIFLIAAACIVAARRRQEDAAPATVPLIRLIKLRPVDAALLAVALLIGVGAYVGSRWALPAHNVVGYETLSVKANTADTGVQVTAQSGREHSYRYVLTVTVGSRQVLARSVRLAPGATDAVTVLLGRSHTARNVTATLKIIGASSPLRQVNLQVPARVS